MRRLQAQAEISFTLYGSPFGGTRRKEKPSARGKKNRFHNLSFSQVEVSPLENAIEVIENKNLQLRTLITQCQNRQMQNINPLTMCLNGVIDAAVNGGLARYQEVGKARWRMMRRPNDIWIV